MQTFGDCADAPCSGPGIEALQTPGQPVIVAFAHTFPTVALWYAIVRCSGRTPYGPADVPPPGSDEACRVVEGRTRMGAI